MRSPLVFLKDYFRRGKAASTAQTRPPDSQGPWTSHMSFIPRKVEAGFYEVMREAVPYIDAGINCLATLDGHIEIVGGNDRLVDEIRDWAFNVPVNDVEKGLHAFRRGVATEAYEQGCGIGEFVTDRQRTDIVGLLVPDSKSFKFRRAPDNSVRVFQQVAGDQEPRPIKRDNLIMLPVNVEHMNPYGTSVLRSLEFVSQTFTTIQNTIQVNFKRWGDPSYHMHYKGANATTTEEMNKIRDDLMTDLKTATDAKSAGQSADIVTVGNLSGEVSIKVIGADGQLLDVAVPMKLVIEQFLAKIGAPAWMLGINWGSGSQMSDAELSVISAGVHSRQQSQGPLYYNLIRNLLLLRGRTWKQGDWKIQWKQVNLHDIYKLAQANFLNSQAEMMRAEGVAAVEVGASDDVKAHIVQLKSAHLSGGACGCKEVGRPRPWPQMDRVEQGYETSLKSAWTTLEERVLIVLKLADPKGAKDSLPAAEAFTYSEEQRSAIFDALAEFTGEFDVKDPDSPVRWYYGQAYSAGLMQAAHMVGAERPELDIIQNSQAMGVMYSDGFKLVKDKATKYIKGPVLREMEAHVLAGSNPRHVADRLRRKFGDANSDWERLARTEMAIAGETAKLSEWSARGIHTGHAAIPGKDTHPRCRCTNSVDKVGDKWVVVFIPAPDACEICLSMAG